MENGKPSGWYDPNGKVRLDNELFSQEFVRAPASEDPGELDPQAEYQVRCRGGNVTGGTLEATAPVEGEIPAR